MLGQLQQFWQDFLRSIELNPQFIWAKFNRSAVALTLPDFLESLAGKSSLTPSLES
jgi:hypothetical protein